ncbi:MAG: hypothetical protein L6R39_000348 [Caloplaca ligustica]|nr:MAG: hypothetical protein L6R39_000348 [Caloplaca ligustica]
MALPPPLPNDNSRARTVVGCAIAFPAMATLAVIGRFVARRLKKADLMADDWLIVLALIAVYGQMIIIILSVVYGGVGHHLHDLTDENLVVYFKLLAAVQFSFGLSLGLAKISICLLLERIFFLREFRILGTVPMILKFPSLIHALCLARCVMVYCVCWTIMTIAIGAGLCRPFAYNWDKSIEGGSCGALNPAYISIAALDILGDTMIIAGQVVLRAFSNAIQSSTQTSATEIFHYVRIVTMKQRGRAVKIPLRLR